MHDPRTPPKPGTLVHLVQQRDTFFNTGKNLKVLKARALGFLHSAAEAEDAVYDFRLAFFVKSGIWAAAEAHDRETEAEWARLQSENSPVDRARFIKERLLLGIKVIRRCRLHFDLLISAVRAFRGFYRRDHFKWFLIRWIKKRRRGIDWTAAGDPDLPDDYQAWDEQALDPYAEGGFLDELDVAVSTKIKAQAMADLPADQRSVLEDQAGAADPDDDAPDAEDQRKETLEQLAGGDASAAALRQRKSKQKARDHYNLLCCAHELVQTRDGIECLKRAALELECDSDRWLLLEHFTVEGPASCPDFFAGRTIDELADDGEDGDAVRNRLLRVLSQIYIRAIVIEIRAQSFAALPQWQQAVLDHCYYGSKWNLGEKPDWTPIQWEIERRKALRDLRHLQEFYLRANNGKSRSLMLKSKALRSAQREFLADHLTRSRNRWHSLEKMAADRRASVETVKEELLEIARLVVKL